MPSEVILRAIASNPNASLVIADALSSNTAELDCGGGVKGQFRLSHMNDFATDRELDDENKASDDDILRLRLNVAFMKQFKNGTVLEQAVQEVQHTHLPPLQKEIGPANVHCWVLVRVGTKRIIWKKVMVC